MWTNHSRFCQLLMPLHNNTWLFLVVAELLASIFLTIFTLNLFNFFWVPYPFSQIVSSYVIFKHTLMYSFVNKLKTGSHYCQPIITTCCGQIMIHKKNNLKDFFVKTIKNKRTKKVFKIKRLKICHFLVRA